MSGDRVAIRRDTHEVVARRRLKQLQEMPLGRLQRRIRHVVDESDLQVARIAGPAGPA